MVFFIPGFLIGLITFPGIILHEYLHKKMCDYLNVKVFDVKYFTLEYSDLFSDTMGYVTHEKTSFWNQTKIGLAPLFGIFPGIILVLISFFLINFSNFFGYLLLWIGFSFLVNMFPSRADINHFFNASFKRNFFLISLYFILLPFIIILYIFSYLEIIWADFIVAIIIILSIFGGINYFQYGEFDNSISTFENNFFLLNINKTILQSKIIESNFKLAPKTENSDLILFSSKYYKTLKPHLNNIF